MAAEVSVQDSGEDVTEEVILWQIGHRVEQQQEGAREK
jgi:hypothetical protein